jgi:lipopolysaccharide biosynthesis glycosyltransferase
MNTVPIVLCADSNILYGLHVTLFSLLKNASTRLKIYLLYKDLAAEDLLLIKKTCSAATNHFDILPILVSDERWRGFRSLVGNTFAYAKLLIPELVSEPRAIYCDSDLLFMLDVCQLFDQNLGAYSIGASGVQNLECALERKFFLHMGLDKKTRVFNSGLLVLDLDKWRIARIAERCFAFGSKYAKSLLAADQTILNAVFRGEFAELDARYNSILYPYSAPEQTYGDSIYHFVGAPKPWDPFGKLFHGHYDLYADYLAHTALQPLSVAANMNWRKARRIARLSRRYMTIALGAANETSIPIGLRRT